MEFNSSPLPINSYLNFVFRCIYSRKVYTLSEEGMIINMLGLLIVVYAGLVIYLTSHRNYKRQPLPEDAILLTGHDE